MRADRSHKQSILGKNPLNVMCHLKEKKNKSALETPVVRSFVCCIGVGFVLWVTRDWNSRCTGQVETRLLMIAGDHIFNDWEKDN